MLPDGTRSPGVEPADAPVVVDRVEALYENIAESFWAAGAPERSYSLFLNLWIYVDVAADYRATIETARVYDTFENFWTLVVDRDAIARGEPIGGWIRLRDNFMSDNGTMLALRGMRVVLELSDGTIVTEPLAFPPPAASTPRERFLVSEEYRGELSGDHAFALARAEIRGVTLNAASIDVVLGPVDRRATNGQVVLLSDARDLVGESPEFFNDISREPRGFLNGGTRLRADEENVVRLSFNELVFVPGASISDARYVYVKLRDGGQYAFTGHSESYLHLSRSELFDLDSVRVLPRD